MPQNLLCTPSDLYDYLSSQGTDLRLDDDQLATGQTIIVTGNAAAGATSLPVTALTAPLLNGTVEHFAGGGTPTVVDVTLAAVGRVGDVSLTVSPLTSAINATAQAQDSGVNVAYAKRLTKACAYATDQVYLYCSGRYDTSVLYQSSLVSGACVNRWAQALAARWMCKRRGQSAPKGIMEDVEEAMHEMERVQAGTLQIPGIGTRTAGWPFMSNVTVDQGYCLIKTRVEPQISEQTPTAYGQFVDWTSVLLLEW